MSFFFASKGYWKIAGSSLEIYRDPAIGTPQSSRSQSGEQVAVAVTVIDTEVRDCFLVCLCLCV